jgi:putative transport protein
MFLLDALVDTLRRYPELALFLTVGIGYWIGSVKLGSVTLGAVTGALFAGLVIGQLHITVSPTARAVLFLLFLFGNGYAVGPQFLKGLQRDGFKPLALTAVVCVAGLAVCVLFARLLGLDPGLAGGLLAGSLTQSPVIGTASEAINALPLPEDERHRLIARVAVGDALTYVFGTFGAIWFLSRIAPRLLGIDLREEARALERSLGIKSAAHGILSAYRPFALRAYRVVDPALAGKSAHEIEAAVGGRMFVLRVRRGPDLLAVEPETIIQAGDVVVLGGRRERMAGSPPVIGEEVFDQELLDFPVAFASVIVTRSDVIGRTLGDLAALPETRGVGLRRMTRLGQEVPILPGTTLERADVLELGGIEKDVQRVAAMVGRIVPRGITADLGAVGLGILAGGLVGALYVTVGGIKIGLGTSVGALLAGVVVGHFAARRPDFGYIPEAAIDLMRNLGLAAFVGMTGLQAAPHFVEALRESGIGLFIAGCICTIVPLLVGVLFGRHVLKMNPVLLLAACAGAQTTTPSLAAVQERAGSQVPVLGYTVPYAIGQIVLTLWGTVIVILVA